MHNRLFIEDVKKQEKEDVVTLKDHRDHLAKLIQKMIISEVKPTSEKDEKNAKNQFNYLNEMLVQIDKMLKLTGKAINGKRILGQKMNEMPKQYFGDDCIPKIDGEKSKAFARLLAEHFTHFTQVKFSDFEIQASIYASKLPLLSIRSIPEQMERHSRLSERIRERITQYEQDNRPKIKA